MQGKSLLFWPQALLLWALIFLSYLAVYWVFVIEGLGYLLTMYWLCIGCIGNVLAGYWVSVMRALGWNCRGIAVRALKAQNKGHKPDIIFFFYVEQKQMKNVWNM